LPLTCPGWPIRYKLMALETKCITMERKITAALRQQFKVLCTAWAKKGISADYTDIHFEFKRNLPVNIKDEAEATSLLRGQVSERTRLALLSFVGNVAGEMKRWRRITMGLLDLDD